MIVNLQIILKELLRSVDLFLADLSRAKIFCIYKMTKIGVICEDKYLVFATF